MLYTMDKMRITPFSLLTYASLITIIVGIILSGWFVAHGEIIFHSDIARDFTLMSQMVDNRKIDLIGEGIRGLSGLYHGPAWLYLNLPAFIVGSGNPVVVGWWWVILEIFYLVSIFWVAKKIFSVEVGLVSTAIIASRIPLFSHQLFNPNGAFFVFPLFFYFMWKYYAEGKSRYLAFTTVLSGLMIQCEIMFGLPMFLSLAGLVILKLAQKKASVTQLLVLSMIVIPLSTYIIFDLRHDFAQIRAVITYLQTEKSGGFGFFAIISNRLKEIFYSVSLISWGGVLQRTIYALFFWMCLAKGITLPKKNEFFRLYVWVNIFFWLFSLLFPEPIKGYYFDFSSINAIIIASQINNFGKYWAIIIILPLLWINLSQAKIRAIEVAEVKGNVESSWTLNKNLGEELVREAPNEFSLFTLGNDIWGYSANYGIRYVAKKAGKTINVTSKSTVTYVVVAKNVINHPLFDVRWWREDQLGLKRKPDETWEYRGLYFVEKYILTPAELSVPVDPSTMSISTVIR